jgi:hypothetical protein
MEGTATAFCKIQEQVGSDDLSESTISLPSHVAFAVGALSAAAPNKEWLEKSAFYSILAHFGLSPTTHPRICVFRGHIPAEGKAEGCPCRKESKRLSRISHRKFSEAVTLFCGCWGAVVNELPMLYLT